MARKVIICNECKALIDKDVIALNKKVNGRGIAVFMCKSCLAALLECTEGDLDVLILDFKEQGCILFR